MLASAPLDGQASLHQPTTALLLFLKHRDTWGPEAEDRTGRPEGGQRSMGERRKVESLEDRRET